MNKTKIFTIALLVSVLLVLIVFVCFEKVNEVHNDVVINTYDNPEIKQSSDSEVTVNSIILSEQEKNENEIKLEQERQKQLKDELDLIYHNKVCNKLSEDEYKHVYTCLSNIIHYSQYLKEIEDSKNCDDYNNDLKRRNDICVNAHATKNLDNDSDYNFMCGYNECLKSKSFPNEFMELNNVFPIQFVKIVDDAVFVKFINNTDIELNVGFIMDELELRYFKDGKFKKIKYDSGVIAIFNNNPIVLPEFVTIGSKESFIVVYAFNTKKFNCKDLSIYLKPDKDSFVFSSFTGVTDCGDPISFQL